MSGYAKPACLNSSLFCAIRIQVPHQTPAVVCEGLTNRQWQGNTVTSYEYF